MPRDFDDGPAETGGPGMAGGRWWSWWAARGRLPLALAAILVGGFVFGYLVSLLAVFPPREMAGELVAVPEVVGETADEARRTLERSGLEYTEAAALHHPRPAGSVVAQEPLGGQLTRPGAEVQVTLSLGPKQRPVPDVVGLSHRQAEIALAQGGYEADVTWVDAEADVGQVVGTRPEPGTPVPLPGKVQLLVSAGPRLVETPDLVSRAVDEARTALERLGLRLGEVTRDSSSLTAPGTVLSQTPAAGTIVDRATRVSVVVAIAPTDSTRLESADTVTHDRTGNDGTR